MYIYIYIFIHMLYTTCSICSRLTPISNCLSTSTSVTQDLATQATQRTRESGFNDMGRDCRFSANQGYFDEFLEWRCYSFIFLGSPFAVWLNWCCLDVVDTADTLQFHLAAWFAHLPTKSKGYSSYLYSFTIREATSSRFLFLDPIFW